MEDISAGFGQRVDLTTRLSEILSNYPENSIIKELIQNADDAGAKTVRILYDRRTHASDKMYFPMMKPLQGPALVVYNDSVFSKEDFESIQRVGGSGKKGNLSKTGRFGIGFNSVYHATDCPSFVSGELLCYFDPHGKFLPHNGDPHGRSLAFTRSSAKALLSEFPDQFRPFELFGCQITAGKPFQGTLFRLPLRSPELAAESKLCKVPYTLETTKGMLANFRHEAPYMLLFVKSVLTLELYEIDEGMSAPRLTFSTAMHVAPHDIPMRAFTARLPSDPQGHVEALRNLTADYEVTVEVSAGKDTPERTRWRIMQSTGKGRAREKLTDPMVKKYGLKLLPWGGVAVQVDPPPPAVGGEKHRAFCFLPLPLHTGLPVHVNGYFELSLNRRDLWWDEQDLMGEGKLRAEWNELLVSDVIPCNYVGVILRLRESRAGSPPEEVADLLYSLFPPLDLSSPPWRIVASTVYSLLTDVDCLWCGHEVGWSRPASCVVASANECPAPLAEALRAAGVPLAVLPDHAAKLLSSEHLTPEGVCRRLQDKPPPSSWGTDHAYVVLDWVLLRIGDAVDLLAGVPLCPLADGTVAAFSARTAPHSKPMLPDPDGVAEKLLRSAPDHLVSPQFTKKFRGADRMYTRAFQSALAVNPLSPETILSYLAHLVPRAPVADDPQLLDFTADLWNYLATVPNLSPTTLEQYARGLAVLPCTDRSVRPLEPVETGSPVIFLGEDLPMDILKALKVPVTTAPPLEVLRGYVEKGSADGVVRVLHHHRDAEMPEPERVREWIAENFTKVGRGNLRRVRDLRVWDVYGLSGVRSVGSAVLPPSPIEDGPAKQILENPWGSMQFVRARPLEREALKTSGVTEPPLSVFWKECFLPRTTDLAEKDPDTFTKAVEQLVQSAPFIVAGNPVFKEMLQNSPLIPTAAGGGTIRPISLLFDPRATELSALLLPDDIAAPTFTASIYDILLSFGMRNSLDAASALRLAASLQERQDPERAKAFAQYLNEHLSQFVAKPKGLFTSLARHFISGAEEDDSFFPRLRSIDWLPVMTKGDHPLLPFPDDTRVLRSAAEVRPQEDKWLCSATTSILDLPQHSLKPEFLDCMGWLSHPLSPEVLVAQLTEVCRRAVEVGVSDHIETVNQVVFALYKELSKHLSSPAFAKALAGIEAEPVVWLGNQFAAPQHVSVGGVFFKGLPGLFELPPMLHPYKNLLLRFGVRPAFTPEDFASALTAMEGHGKLEEQQILTVVALLNYLADKDCRVTTLPDADGLLRPPNALLYDDMKWETLSPSSPELEGRALVHPRVAQGVAEALGVMSRRSLAITGTGCEEWSPGDMQMYGQHEDLTSRLSDILRLYPDGMGILNELIQNADDARATEVAVLWDKTQYGTDSLISKEMARWQGPALYFFNNSTFSEHDYRNLGSIGQGSKLELMSKIGRFGLGFNAVYHFTDVPSFVSGGYVTYLDPHEWNLIKGNRGLRINLPSQAISRFEDQFTPYRHFGCAMDKPFDGTLFRFPLRTEETARHSEIRKEAYPPEAIGKLLERFADTANEVLLFLRHVVKLRVLVVDGKGEPPRELLSVVVDRSKDSKQARDRCMAFVGSNRDQLLRNLSERESVSALETLNVTVVRDKKKIAEEWVVSTVVGGGKAKELALTNTSKQLRLIPLSSVALQCKVDGDPAPPMVGRAFTFLPLPAVTGLAYHLNGSFELSSNRRNIWYGDDLQGEAEIRSVWNVALLQDAAAPAAVAMLLHTKSFLPMDRYWSLWPSEGMQPPWSIFAEEVLCRVLDKPVLRSVDGKRWFSPAEALIIDDATAEAHPEVSNLLAGPLERSVAILPAPLAAKMLNVLGNKVNVLTPAACRKLLRGRKGDLWAHKDSVTVALLAYCTTDITEENVSDLDRLPLVPLANGGTGWIRCYPDDTPLDKQEIYFRVLSRGKAMFERHPDMVIGKALAYSGDLPILKKLYTWPGVNLRELQPHFGSYIVGRLLAPPLRGRDVSLPDDPLTPRPAWVMAFWELFLNQNVLETIEGWPIIPTNTGHLVSPAALKRVLLTNIHFSATLVELGVFTLDTSVISKDSAQRYLGMRPTDAGCILDGLLASGCISSKRFEGIEAKKKRELLEWFAETPSLKKISAEQQDILRSLPIFERYGSDRFWAIEENDKLVVPPVGVDEHLLSEAFVKVPQKEKAVDMFNLLRVPGPMEQGRFYAEYYLPTASSRDPKTALEVGRKILKNRALEHSYPPLKDALATHAWVPAKTGIHRPCDLYHPKLIEQDILPPSSTFPHGDFNDPESLKRLEELGLRGRISFDAVCDCATRLENEEDPVPRAAKLLRYLADHLEGHEDDPALEQLNNVKWLPVIREPPADDVPWNPSLIPVNGMMAPRDVRPAKQGLLCSCSKGLVVPRIHVPAVLEERWWSEPLAPEVLIQQLVSASERGTVKESTVGPVLTEINHRLCNEDEAMRHAILRSTAQSIVFVGNALMRPQDVCLNEMPVDGLGPYLRQLPHDVRTKWKEFYDLLNLSPTFESAAYGDVLRRMNAKYSGRPISTEDLGVVTAVTSHLASEPGNVALAGRLYLPDNNKVLHPTHELAYDDMDWRGESQDRCGRLLCRELRNVAEPLNVVSLRQRMTMNKDLWEPLRCPDLDSVVGLVEGRSKAAVALDMIELADLIGSTSMRVVLDRRSHTGHDRIMPGTEALQGPALVFILDRVLDHREIEGLMCRMALSDVTMVEGTGINTGFTLASCIQVLLRDRLLMFDPGNAVLKDATARSFPVEKLVTTFPSQLGVFRIPEAKANNTVIRMPLRTSPSPLGPPTTIDDTHAALRAFVEAAPRRLPLLENIIELSSTVLTDEGSTSLFEARIRFPTPALVQVRKEMWKSSKWMTGSGMFALLKSTHQNAIHEVEITVEQRCEYDISEQPAKPNEDDPVSPVDEGTEPAAPSSSSPAKDTSDVGKDSNGHGGMKPAKHVDPTSPLTTTRYTWLVSQTVGFGKTERKAAKLLETYGIRVQPIGGVAACILKDGLPISDREELSRTPGCPVERLHRTITKHIPKIRGADREAWNAEEGQNTWHAYAKLIEHMCQPDGPFRSNPMLTYLYWPHGDGLPGAGLDAIYDRLLDKKVFLLSGSFQKYTAGLFPCMPLSNPIHCALSQKAQDTLFNIDNMVLDELLKRKHSSIDQVLLKPDRVRRYCGEAQGRCLYNTIEEAVELLEYATLDVGPDQGAKLRGTRLLPVQASTPQGFAVRRFDEGKVYMADDKASSLMPKEASLFIHPKALASGRLDQLWNSLSFRNALGIQKLDGQALSKNMSFTPVPLSWQGRHEVAPDKVPDEVKDWLRTFWEVIPASEMQHFGQWPLLPTSSGLLPLKFASSVFTFDPNEIDDDDDTQAAEEDPSQEITSWKDYPPPPPPPPPPPSPPEASFDADEMAPPSCGGSQASSSSSALPSLHTGMSMAMGLLHEGIRIKEAFGAFRSGLAGARGRSLAREAVHDHMALARVARQLELPIAADEVANHLLEIRLPGNQQQVALAKLSALTKSFTARWENLSYRARMDLLDFLERPLLVEQQGDGSRAEKPQVYAQQEEGVLRVLPIFTTLGDRSRCTALGLSPSTAPRMPFFRPTDPSWVCDSHPKLLDALRVERWSVERVWKEKLIPEMSGGSPEEVYDMLSYLREYIGVLPGLLEVLKETPLIPSCGKEPLRACDLLDPRIDYCRDLCTSSSDRNCFPADEYNNDTWYPFLEKIGMRTTIDATVFVHLATAVHEQRSCEVSDALARKGEYLVKHIVKEFAALVKTTRQFPGGKDGFLAAVQRLAFVPLADPRTRQLRLHRFSDCSHPSVAPLTAFLLAPLPDDWTPQLEEAKQLGIEVPPSLEKVVESLLATTEEYPLPSCRKEDFSKVLAFLESSKGVSTWRGALSRLQACHCLPITDTLTVKFSRVFEKCKPSPPFINRLPERYISHLPLLRELGVRPEVTRSDLQRIIAEIGREYTVPLSTTELSSVISMLEVIAEGEEHCALEYIVDEKAVLRRTGTVVFNDAPWLFTRVVPSSLVQVHPRLTKRTCEKLRVPSLQQVITEAIDPDFQVTPVDRDVSLELTNKFQSDEFVLCLLELIEHQQLNPYDTYDHRFLSKKFAGYCVVLVHELRTRLYLAGQRDITERSECHYFVERPSAQPKQSAAPPPPLRIFIARDSLPSSLSVETVLARCLTEALELPIIPYVADLLRAPPRDMARLLNVLQVSGGSGVGAGLEGTVGRVVSAADGEAAQCKPLAQFVEGEMVAWEDTSKVKRYGIVTKVTGDDGSSSEVVVNIRPSVHKSFVPAGLWKLPMSYKEHSAPSLPVQGGRSEPPRLAAQKAASKEAERDQLAETLTTLMDKLDISVGESETQLLHKLSRRTRELEKEQKERAKLERSLEQEQKKLSELEEELTCPLCYTERVNMVIVPCGHVVCQVCAHRLGGQCYCREAMTGHYKIFM